MAALTLPVLITVFSYGYFPVQADETNLAWVAKQVAMARAPYGDFFSFIPPLTLYGLGAYFKIVGSGLAALRLLSIAWLAATTLLLYGCLRRCDTPSGWAAAAAFAVPAIYVPYWPVSSHHYLAMGFGLAACFLVWTARPTSYYWFAGGILCGLSGLTLQTEGAFFTGLLGLKLLLDPIVDRRRSALAGVLGLFSPTALYLLILEVNGTLGMAFRDLLLWPMKYYKQPGGFNDVPFLSNLADLIRASWPAHFAFRSAAPIALLLIASALPLMALVLPLMDKALKTPWERNSRSAMVAPLGILLCLLIYSRGRTDWAHLVLWAPVLVFLTFQPVEWPKETLRPAVLKSWLIAVLLLSAVRWPLYWVRHPPSLRDVSRVDREFQERTILPLIHALPGVEEGNLPFLYLSGQGSGYYLYWAPVPPPVDWLLPPTARYNAPWEYERLARFAKEHRIPVVVIPERYYEAFLNDASPLRDELRQDYHPDGKTAWGIVLRRKPDEQPPP